MRIGIISPDPAFSDLARELAAHEGLEVLVAEGALEAGVAIARRWEQEQAVELIIGRGATAAMVAKEVALPVTAVPVTAFDLVDALYRARLAGGRVALIAEAGEDRDYAHLGRIAGVEFAVVSSPAQTAGYTTLVGTEPTTLAWAEERGLAGVPVHTGREALGAALQQAAASLRAARLERVRNWRNRTLLSVSSDGILALDEEGKLYLCNRSAERLLGIRTREVIGRPAAELAEHPRLGPLLAEAKPLRAELLQVDGLHLVVNRATLEGGNLVVSFQAAAQVQALEEKIRKQLHAKGLVARYTFDSLVGESPVFRQALERARKFAGTEFSVLITGKSGTGKELLAHAIHTASRRAGGPFVAVNCAALPETLLESELFGYEEGAFTGARKGGKPGLFELAHGGTIFLDEIGEVGLGPQSRLLRVLQNREVMRIGGDRLIPVDVRVITATNRDLAEAMAAGRFREDLYYRLNVLHVHLPALRERREDLPLLARHILEAFGRKTGMRVELPPEVIPLLQGYDWPGNVRELENFLQRFVVLSRGAAHPVAVARALMDDMQGGQVSPPAEPPAGHLLVEVGTLEEIELQVLRQLDRQVGHDRTALARMLGISRTTLWRKLKPVEQI